jgi:Coenzyme PQQ synthesis protein D (PqqD)
MVTLNSHLRSIVSQDGAVILDIPHNALTTLNSTGAYIWERLQRGISSDAIAVELARDTGIDESTVAKDIDEFIEQLQAKHLATGL